MIKYNLVNSFIGNVYPFFLSNNKLTMDPSYYLYQIVSPKLSPDLIPYISLEKISEKTKVGDSQEPYGQGSDIISACLGGRDKSKGKEVSFVKNILWKDNPIIDDNGTEFPLIEMENGNNIQKSIVIGLRDSIRWKTYKFQPGFFVDILWDTDKYMIFKFCGDKQNIWMEPVGLYSNMDPGQKNPIQVDLMTIDYPSDKWSISDKNKASEINRVIKKMEWRALGERNNKE